jgi:hypothetical protein
MQMSFLDDLESNLKSLESSEEGKEDRGRQQRAREQERASARAVAPFAEILKTGPYTAELLKQAALTGHSLRVKVHVVWLGTTLRLEARERRLELRPTPDGVLAVYLEGNREIRSQALNLEGSAEQLVRDWLGAADRV